ncbi:MAG: hypothetical protein PHF57_12240 [Methanoregula sp.]|nr:hypothetical protein [Methanoregula sp.]MDD5188965.1 hypothetical protein [Methanoregula sp.]
MVKTITGNPFEEFVDHLACNLRSNGSVDCIFYRDEVPAGYSRIKEIDIPVDTKVDLASGMMAKLLSKDLKIGVIYSTKEVIESGEHLGECFGKALINRPGFIEKVVDSPGRRHCIT